MLFWIILWLVSGITTAIIGARLDGEITLGEVLQISVAGPIYLFMAFLVYLDIKISDTKVFEKVIWKKKD